MSHRNQVEGATFDAGEVQSLIQEFAHSGYKFKALESGKVGVTQPDGMRADYSSLASAMQGTLRRMYWHINVTNKAVALEHAQKELDEAVQKLESITQ